MLGKKRETREGKRQERGKEVGREGRMKGGKMKWLEKRSRRYRMKTGRT